MNVISFDDKLRSHSQWREQLCRAVEEYRSWLERYHLYNEAINDNISGLLDNLRNDRIVVAFAAEFSRGKTELINALFFADTGVRLLPSSPGRTTMCPTEIFYDSEGGSYIRLLAIETRLSDTPLSEYKQHPEHWIQIQLDQNSPLQMQEAFRELAAIKRVPLEEARQLGLYFEDPHSEPATHDDIEVPCWRHALISFSHPLLKEGLTILDTPGLNALGTEPELTLQMLPSAQAIIFVLAADTGVTKSDLEMWRNHVILGCRHGQWKGGLVVVMNKIDFMWGDLLGEEGIEKAIRSQIKSVSKTLAVEEAVIFPLSAKQALLAKVRGDNDLLKKTRLDELEAYLSGSMINQRQNLLVECVKHGVGSMIQDSVEYLQVQINDLESQITDLHQIDIKNEAKTNQLMKETRDQQKVYMTSVEQFQTHRRKFALQAKLLIDILVPEKIEEIIKRTRRDMAGSLTTVGMKGVMREVLDELHVVLNDAMNMCEEVRNQVKGLYLFFQKEYGFAELKPPLLSFKQYQAELGRVFEEGEAFRSSAASTLLEQSAVITKLYSTTISRARALFEQAHQDANSWTGIALVPLIHQIKDRKRLIETRLEALRKINEKNESLESEISSLVERLAGLRQQFAELDEIRYGLQLEQIEPEEEVSEEESYPPSKAATH
jgi:peptidoglycan hydrolase CwlO-like protein